MDGKISGHTTRTMKHSGRTYEKGAKVSFPVDEFNILMGLGFVEATAPVVEKIAEKKAKA